MAQKRCPYCGDVFEPKPHLVGTQTCCGQKRCKAKRKTEAHARWLIDNPNYFKGRYSRTQLWLSKHPGYLQGYREANADYVRRDNEARRQRRIRARRRADIQDAWPRREIRRIQGGPRRRYTRHVPASPRRAIVRPGRNTRADIQDIIDPAGAPGIRCLHGHGNLGDDTAAL